MRWCIIIAVFFGLLICIASCDNGSVTDTPLSSKSDMKSRIFHLVPPSESGLNFQNTLDEGLNTNILMYEYFYNGGGVGIGDFNNDGLQDVYLTSNMGENELYLNKRDLKFENVTLKSGAGGRPGPWKTGVSIADVNGDGLLDIYLCYSGAMPEVKRKNQLFINLGNDADSVPRFEDRAEQYGLASAGFSNQAYFFDYDKDGDLDMLLLNHNPKNLPILNEVNTAELLKIDDPLKGVRLFRNEVNKFIDVTQSSGISSSALTYGLGIGISDFDQDGWADFYISNDYSVPDYLYINDQKGGFVNHLTQSIGHISQFSMGNDVVDFNNDGLVDIITLDMRPEDNRRQKLLMAPDDYNKFDLNVRSGFYNQYMRNMLQLNNGNGTFSEIGQYAQIESTDWSWAALAADYDNDGWRDLYITNGYKSDYTNLDFINYMNDFTQKKGRLVREDVIELIENMPASDVINYAFKGQSTLQFEKVTREWGLEQVANSNGAAYADLDNDGDLDLVINNINQDAFLYENMRSSQPDNNYLQLELKGTGLNRYGLGAKIDLFSKFRHLLVEQNPARGYLSSVSPIMHVGLGELKSLDSIIITWPSGKQQKLVNIEGQNRLTINEVDADFTSTSSTQSKAIFQKVNSSIDYSNPRLSKRDFDRQRLLLKEMSAFGPMMIKGDVNNDGLIDVFVGGAKGQTGSLYIQKSEKNFQKLWVPDFLIDKESEDSDACFLDVNNDGWLDLYVASGGNHDFNNGDKSLQDRLYMNDGKGNLVKRENSLPLLTTSNNVTRAIDFNGDGYIDIFIGSRMIPGRYPELPRSYILLNKGDGSFEDASKSILPDNGSLGMVTDASWRDINLDGHVDLIVVGEWNGIKIYLEEKNKLIDKTTDYFDKEYKGWWNKLLIHDFNNDGRPDILAGNFGWNTPFSVSDDQPAKMYYGDFDNNGSIDPIFCFYNDGESYPFVTRDELFGQIGSLRSKFPTYQSFSNATLSDIFSSNQLKDAKQLEINTLSTSLFLSTNDGKLERAHLPNEVQYSPIYAIQSLDFNDDGNLDLFLAGNDQTLKLRLGSCDANYGMLLQGDGKGHFTYIDQVRSGLNISGDVRSMLQIDDIILIGKNQGKVEAVQLTHR